MCFIRTHENKITYMKHIRMGGVCGKHERKGIKGQKQNKVALMQRPKKDPLIWSQLPRKPSRQLTGMTPVPLETQSLHEVGLKLITFLSQPPQCWNCRQMPAINTQLKLTPLDRCPPSDWPQVLSLYCPRLTSLGI